MAYLTNLFEDIFQIHGQQFPISDKNIPGNNDIPNILAVGGINDLGYGVIKGNEVWSAGIDNNDIRLFSGFKGSDNIVKADGFSAADSRHVEYGPGIHDCGIEGVHLVKLCRSVHFPKKI